MDATSGGSWAVLRPAQVRSTNATTVLRILLAAGPLSRSDIAERMGLTHGPVTRIVAKLVHAGLVEDLEPLDAGGPGRPRVPVALVSGARHAVGVHVGASDITAGAVDLSGRSGPVVRARHDGTPEQVAGIIADLHAELVAGVCSPSMGVGVITAGWVDPRSGTVRRQPLLGWSDVDLRRLVQERIGVWTVVESTARGLAAADLLYGAVTGGTDAAHVFVGNALEVGVIVGGQVHLTEDGFGGDVADLLLPLPNGTSRPAREALADLALLAEAHRRGGPEVPTLAELVGLRDDPEHGPVVRAVLADAADLLGHLLASVSTVLGPQTVVVTSPVGAFDGCFARIEALLQRVLPDGRAPRVQRGAPGRSSVVSAAAAAVIQGAILDPFAVTAEAVAGIAAS